MLDRNPGAIPRPRRWLRSGPSIATFTLICLAACHVKLVSDYDRRYVEQATATQIDIDTLLQTQVNPPPGVDTSYEASKAAYNKIDVDIDTLLTLAKAHASNDATVAQVNTLAETVNGLEERHRKDGRLPTAYVQEKQNDIRIQVSAMIRTENAKRAAN